AFEADVDGEHVAEDGGEADQEPGEEEFGVELIGGEMGAAEEVVADEHGDERFEEVECEDEGEEFAAQESGDVGCADVSGAGFAGIDAFGEADEEAEGDRAEEVGDGGEEEELVEGDHRIQKSEFRIQKC